MRLIAYTLLLNALFVNLLDAQPQAFQAASPMEVVVDGTNLDHPFTGGMEAPQFRPFLLNNDGYADLLVFDRIGAKLLPFIAEPNEDGSIDYRYAPELEQAFPAERNQLLMVQDLNCDGWPDFVTTEIATTAADVTLKVSLREPGFPMQFAEAQTLYKRSPNGTLEPLHIHAYDVPVLKDLNGDNRSDLLYIPIGGTHLQYYQQVGDCGDLVFELADSCWGNAAYTVEADFQLNVCEPGFRSQGCAGSVMFCKDYDGDGDQDLWFSGLYDEHVLRLENDGGLESANLISQEFTWLNDGQALTRFPSPFPLRYSGTVEDLVVATNIITGQGYSPANDKVLRFEKDDEVGGWTLAEDQFMLDEMIDFGFRSNIALQDIDGDGLKDLLLAYNDRHPTFSYNSSIAVFKNIGTAEAPAFELMTRDWLNLSIYNFKSIAPSFGDFNGDGLDDLLIGLENNGLRLFYRQGDNYILADGQPLHELSFNGLVRPTVADYDQDGLLDVLCGTRNGTITYLQNTGSTIAPEFTRITDTLGGIFQTEGFFQECSVALLPKETGESGFWLYYGRRNGKVDLYETNGLEAAQLVRSALPGLDMGERISIQLGDLNNDGTLELWGGNARGGVEVFAAQPLTNTKTVYESKQLKIFPNPAQHQAQVQLPASFEGGLLEAFDASGRLMLVQPIDSGVQYFRLSLEDVAPGLYYYRIKTSSGRYNGRLVVNH
jgi:hypothetical protein